MTKEEHIAVGMPNTTGILSICEIVDDINRSISGIQSAGGERIAKVLKVMQQAVVTGPRLEKHERRETLRALQRLAREASLPPEERQINAVRFALEYILCLLDGNLNRLNYFKVHVEDLLKYFDID